MYSFVQIAYCLVKWCTMRRFVADQVGRPAKSWNDPRGFIMSRIFESSCKPSTDVLVGNEAIRRGFPIIGSKTEA